MIVQIKTKTDLSDFNYALNKAYQVACDFVQCEDGGACNYDTCIIKVKIAVRLRELTSFRLLKLHDSNYDGYWMIDFPVSGNGDKRRKMVEVASNFLRRYGYASDVYRISVD